MEAEVRGHELLTFHDYVRVARRRKWAIVLAVVLLVGAAVLFSLQQQRLYQASADVLLSRQNIAASLSGTPDPSVNQQPQRISATQAGLAAVPDVAERVLDAAGLDDRTPQQFLNASSVMPRAETDLLTFRVTDSDRGLAIRLATEYARQFTIYRRELDTAALERARVALETQIGELKRAKETKSRLYANLVSKQQQLATMEALQTGNTSLVRSATTAAQVQPKLVRNVVLGLGVGLMLGIILAFLWEALDTRIRSADEIGAALHLPLLARLPEPPRQVREQNGLVMLTDPGGSQGEAFRMLRTNFDFATLGREARAIMVTSALESEGKSTTAGNLAVALARAGRRVALVDLDLRRPYLARFFDLNGRPGVTDVALGHVALDEALVPIVVADPGENIDGASGNGRSRASIEGLLEVLPSGPTPPDTGEFVGTRAVAGIVEALRQRADIVVIDAPPLLHVGDAMVLSAQLDALLIVTRVKLLRRATLRELHRVLNTMPVHKLGFVLAGAEKEDGYGYGYGYGSGYTARPSVESEAEAKGEKEEVAS
jgi:polysaccharide biosynthesis transport protein